MKSLLKIIRSEGYKRPVIPAILSLLYALIILSVPERKGRGRRNSMLQSRVCHVLFLYVENVVTKNLNMISYGQIR
jgi:hypothetical protein